jgi:predicted membrane chloride channel (bestrophin family)
MGGVAPAKPEATASTETAPADEQHEAAAHEAGASAGEHVLAGTPERAENTQAERTKPDASSDQEIVIGGSVGKALANVRGVLPKNVWVDALLCILFFGLLFCSIRECVSHYHITRAEDKHTNERQIVHYDPDRLVHLSILLRLFAKGSLCSKGKVWYQVLFHFCLWCILTMVLLSGVKYAERLDDRPIRTLSKYLNSFMPFFFAMYLNVVFNRWWTMRTAGLGSMWQAVDDLCVMLASHCPGDEHKEQRGAMLRYGMLSQALIYHTARKDLDLQRLVDDGLLTESEKHVLHDAPGSKPQLVWVWILDLWKSLHTKGHIEWWVLQEAQDSVVEGRRSVKTALTYITCQIPFGWVHLMTLMVNITILVLVLKSAIIAAKDIADMWNGEWPCILDIDRGFVCNTDFRDEVGLLSQIIQLVIVPFLFLAFLEFTNELSNPFGEDPHDFPRNVYMTGMRNENLGFFTVAGKGAQDGSLIKKSHEMQ